MARQSKKVYLYDEDGSFLRKFESISEFSRNFNFSENIFSHDDWLDFDNYLFKDGRVASLNRIGREGVKKFKQYVDNKFVGGGKKRAETNYKKTNKGKVLMYDLDGDLIAEFKSIFQAILLTGFDPSCFSIEKGKKSKKTRNGITIKVEPYNT